METKENSKIYNWLIIIFGIILVFPETWFLQDIWNTIMPKINVPTISYWLAMSLLMFKAIIFKSGTSTNDIEKIVSGKSFAAKIDFFNCFSHNLAVALTWAIITKLIF